jgi:hypothetical protein
MKKRGYYGDPKKPTLKNTAYCINHRPAIYTRIYNNCIVKDCTKQPILELKILKRNMLIVKITDQPIILTVQSGNNFF